jgi:hypothetical protein
MLKLVLGQRALAAIIFCGLAFLAVRSEAGFMIAPPEGQNYIECEGYYPGHLQGITTNGVDEIYWSFNNRLVKTDASGKLLQEITVPTHHGDLSYSAGKIYVAINLGPFNQLTGANSWVYTYDANTLTKIAEHPLPQPKYGAGGIEYHNGKFYVVGGLHTSENKNYVYEYDSNFAHLKTHELETGYTDRGIQTATYGSGSWWFGTYHSLNGNNNTRQLFKYDAGLTDFSQSSFDASLGIASIGNNYLLIGSNRNVSGKGYVGRIDLAVITSPGGLQIVPVPVPEPQSVILISGAAVAACRSRCWHQRRKARVCR